MQQKYTYEKHCEEMKGRGFDPMPEHHFIKMQEECPPVPKVRPIKGSKLKDPILDLYKDEE